MRLSHALVAFVGTFAALVTAAPMRRFETPGTNSSEVLAANGDPKPLEKNVAPAKQRPRARFRSLTERRLRKRAEQKNEPKPTKSESGFFDYNGLMKAGGGTNSGEADESGRSKPVGGTTSDGATPVDGGKPGSAGGDNGGGHKSEKKVGRPKSKSSKGEKPKKKGGIDVDQDGSDDDPGTDNASENEHGTDDDEA